MADDAIQPAGDNEARMARVQDQIEETEIHLAPTQQQVDVAGAIKLPLEHISELGVAFSSLPRIFRAITTTVNVPTLLQATDRFGNSLDPSILQKFNDGSGHLGSYRDAMGNFSQVRLHTVGGSAITSISHVPYDPTKLFMAVALAQVNQKLNSIQKSVDEMFEYMRQRDKADMHGNLMTLDEILKNYGLNYGNTTYMKNAHMKVLDIKQKAEQDMELYRTQAQSKLRKEGIVEVRTMVDKRSEKVLDYLKDCQLATYIYSFALFLEPMLAENFKPDKLQAIARRIEDESLRYRQLYTECFDAINASATGSINAVFLGGVASVGKVFGKAMEATPVGEYTVIDEAFKGAGEGLDHFNDEQSNKLVEKLREARAPDVLPFKQSIENINILYNQPTQLAIDAENIYILPGQSGEE